MGLFVYLILLLMFAYFVGYLVGICCACVWVVGLFTGFVFGLLVVLGFAELVVVCFDCLYLFVGGFD